MDWTRNLRLRQLHMLERLCEVKNLSQVAREFQLTQPALSKWLSEFESSLGTPLFRRHARGVTPLPLALELARQARGVTGRLEKARQVVAQMTAAAGGHLTVGVNSMAAIVLLPQVLQAFHSRHSGVFLQIIEGSFDTLVPALRSGEIDLVIGRIETGGLPYDLSHEQLCNVVLRLAACTRHPLAGKPSVSWQEAFAYPWMAPGRQSPIRQQMDQAFDQIGLGSPNVVIESSFVSTTLRVLPGTQLVAPMAAFLSDTQDTLTTLNVPWRELGLDASLSIIWRPEDDEFLLLQAFAQCVRSEAAHLGD